MIIAGNVPEKERMNARGNPPSGMEELGAIWGSRLVEMKSAIHRI